MSRSMLDREKLHTCEIEIFKALMRGRAYGEPNARLPNVEQPRGHNNIARKRARVREKWGADLLRLERLQFLTFQDYLFIPGGKAGDRLLDDT